MKKTTVLIILFFILDMSLLLSLKVKQQSYIFDCDSLSAEPTISLPSNISEQLKEYNSGELNIKDVSIRKGQLVACAALKSLSTKFGVYTFNLDKNTFSLLSDQDCDSVAVNINGVIHVLKNSKVFFFEKGKWIPLNDSIDAKDFAFSHDTATLYYLDSKKQEAGGGIIRKYENSKIETRNGSANLIDTGINGDLYVINSLNNFFVAKFGKEGPTPWSMKTGKFLDLAACENGDVFTIGNEDGFIYQFLATSQTFTVYFNSGKFEKITCGANSSQLYAVKTNKEFYRVYLDQNATYNNNSVSLIDISTRNGLVVGCGKVTGSSINYVLKYDSNFNASFVGTQPCSRVAVSSNKQISAAIDGNLMRYDNSSWKLIKLQNLVRDFAFAHSPDSSALFYLDFVDPSGAQGGGMVRKYENEKESLRDGRAFFIDVGETSQIVVVNSNKNLFHTIFSDLKSPPWQVYPSVSFKDNAICKNNVVAAITVDSLMLFSFVENSQLTLRASSKINLNAITCGDSQSDLYGIDADGRLVKVKT